LEFWISVSESGLAYAYGWQFQNAEPSDAALIIENWFYGYVSDERIATVELLIMDKETGQPTPMSEQITDDHMFLFLWEAKDSDRDWQSLHGLDKNGRIIYEQKLG
jgi:hypothetical protein